MGVIVVVTNRKNFYLKSFIIFLILISFSFVTGCGFLQHISSLTVKPSLPIDSAKSDKDKNNNGNTKVIVHKNKKSNRDQANNSHKFDKDKADNNGHTNHNDRFDKIDNENRNPRIDNNSVVNNKDNHDDVDNSRTNNKDNADNNSDTDNSNVGNKDMMDSNKNIKDNTIDDKDNNNEDMDQTNKSADSDKVEAKPAAKVIHSSENKELKKVAITFDDGPDEYFTPQVLDILKEYNVKATFFIVGSLASKNKDVLKRIDQEGHVVASHGWSHSNFTKISDKKIIQELQKTNELIEEVIGKPTSLFRLPYGAFNKRVLNTVAKQGYHNIYWSIDPRDWSGISSKEILDNIKKNLEPGAIILLHSSGSKKSIPNTVKALPQIIEYLQEQGYEIVTIPELLEDYLMVNSTPN